jgi:hypothetical protein
MKKKRQDTMNKDNELMVMEDNNSSINLIKDENKLKTENHNALAVVHEVLHNKEKPVIVNGKRHLEFEDWIALGNAFGIAVRTGEAEPVEIFEAKGFKARAEVVRVSDGIIIGGAEAYCLNNERNWRNKDYFQMASMAQTRAGSKALSNQLRGFVSLDKNLNGTPSEEMVGINNEKKGQVRRRKKAPAQPKKEKEAEEEVIDAEIVEKPKSDNPALVLKGTDNVVLGEWFRKIIQKLERRGDELTKKNFARISKLWAFDNQYPDFTEETCKELLNHVEEA